MKRGEEDSKEILKQVQDDPMAAGEPEGPGCGEDAGRKDAIIDLSRVFQPGGYVAPGERPLALLQPPEKQSKTKGGNRFPPLHIAYGN
jgi:hypothetical protein